MGKARLLNTNDLDGRTRSARWARALERQLVSAFDCELPPHQLILIRSAAELAAIAEQVRATHLAGGPVSLNDVVRRAWPYHLLFHLAAEIIRPA